LKQIKIINNQLIIKNMKVLNTILDFILSVGRLFFRGNGKGQKGRQFCPQCGALLRADCPCGCCNPSNGSGSGINRGADGVEETGKEHSIDKLMGWTLIAVAVVRWVVVNY